MPRASRFWGPRAFGGLAVTAPREKNFYGTPGHFHVRQVNLLLVKRISPVPCVLIGHVIYAATTSIDLCNNHLYNCNT